MGTTAGFIDLATFETREGRLYDIECDGHQDPFHPVTQKTDWYTIIPHILNLDKTVRDFDSEFDIILPKIGEHIIRISLKVVLPEVILKNSRGNCRLRWTRNLMHNLVRKITLTAGDIILLNFDSIALDHLNKYTRNIDYYKLIGNIPELINPTSIHQADGIILPQTTLWLPIEILTNGRSIPIGVTAFQDIVLNLRLRSWLDLLSVDDFSTGKSRQVTISDLIEIPKLVDVEIVSEYVLCTKARQREMVGTKYEIIMDSCQTVTNTSALHKNHICNIPVTGSVKTLYFGIKNKSNPADNSNYSTVSPFLKTKIEDFKTVPDGIIFYPKITEAQFHHRWSSTISKKISKMPDQLINIVLDYIGSSRESYIARDPLLRFRLGYGETTRLDMDAQFFSTVHPLAVSGKCSDEIGYHMYSYGEKLKGDPSGSTNYDKLSVWADVKCSDEVLNNPENFELFIVAVSHHPIQIFGGIVRPDLIKIP